MSTLAVVLIAVAAAAIAVALFWFFQKHRSERLHTQFGPEYGRTVEAMGDRRKAETELERRQKRTEKFEMRPISPEDRRRFADAWKVDQAAFVDEPQQAVVRGHQLVDEVMKARGYPVSAEFEQNAADLSVDHPHVVEHYRRASEIAAREEAGQANTEDLRNAMVSYRTLFEELLGSPTVNQSEEVKR